MSHFSSVQHNRLLKHHANEARARKQIAAVDGLDVEAQVPVAHTPPGRGPVTLGPQRRRSVRIARNGLQGNPLDNPDNLLATIYTVFLRIWLRVHREGRSLGTRTNLEFFEDFLETFCTGPQDQNTSSTTRSSRNPARSSAGTTATSAPAPAANRKHSRQSGGEPPDRDRRGKRGRTSGTEETSQGELEPRWACPFYLHDHQQYRQCARFSAANIRVADVRQHIVRCHSRSFCPICGRVFENDFDEVERNSHIGQKICLEQPVPDYPGVTLDQRNQLGVAGQRHGPTCSRLDRWLAMWDIVLPGIPRPASPYHPGSEFQILLQRGAPAIFNGDRFRIFLDEISYLNPGLRQALQDNFIRFLYQVVLPEFVDQETTPSQPPQRDRPGTAGGAPLPTPSQPTVSAFHPFPSGHSNQPDVPRFYSQLPFTVGHDGTWIGAISPWREDAEFTQDLVREELRRFDRSE